MAVGLCLIWYSGMPFCGRTTGIRVFLLFQPFETTLDLQTLLSGVAAGYGNRISLYGQFATSTTGAATPTGVEYILCAVAQARAAVESLQDTRGLPHLCVERTTGIADLELS